MISLEAILYLVIGFIGGRLVGSAFIFPYIAPYYFPLLKYGISPLAYFFDLVTIVGFVVYLIRERRGWTDRQRLHFVIATGLINIIVGTLFLANGHAFYSHMFGTYDGAVQTEIAAQAITDGHNPYTLNYRGTAFGDYLKSVNMDGNPMLDHYAYPPLVPLLSIPTLWLGQVTHTEPQVRFVGLVAVVLTCLLLIFHVKSAVSRVRVALLTIFNPLVYVYALVGFNDGLYIFFTIFAAVLLLRRRWVFTGVAIGLSIASKQTAWLFLPLWAGLVFAQYRQHNITLLNIRNLFLGIVLATSICYLPFVVANAAALFDDIVRFITSAGSGVHDVAGISLWQIPVLIGYYKNEGEFIPTAVVQLVIAVLLFPVGARRVYRLPTMANMFWVMVIVLFIFGISNRFFYEHYFTSYILLVVAGMVFHEQDVLSHTASAATSGLSQ